MTEQQHHHPGLAAARGEIIDDRHNDEPHANDRELFGEEVNR